jgi:hypothetical protein
VSLVKPDGTNQADEPGVHTSKRCLASLEHLVVDGLMESLRPSSDGGG